MTAPDNLAALAHGKHRRAIDVAPELCDLRMGAAPFGLERLDFGIGELLRLEVPPRIQSTLITEGEVAGLPDTALR